MMKKPFFEKLKKIKLSVPCAVFLALFIFNSFWGIQQYLMYRQGNTFDNAKRIEHGRITASDEGAKAIATGKLTPTEIITDGDFGCTFDCLVLERKVEMYQNLIVDDEVVTEYCDYGVGNIVGENGETVENPAFPSAHNTIWLGSGYFDDGELKLGQGFMEMLYDIACESETICFVVPDRIPDGFALCEDNSLVNGNPDNPAVGDIRISYRALTQGGTARVLAVGEIHNGYLVKTLDHISQITHEAETFEEFKELAYGEHRSSALGFVMFAAICLVFFIIFFIKSKRPPKNKSAYPTVKINQNKRRLFSLLLLVSLLSSFGVRAFADFGDFGGDSDYGYDSYDSYDYDSNDYDSYDYDSYDYDSYDYDYDDDDDDSYYFYDYNDDSEDSFVSSYYHYEKDESDTYRGGYSLMGTNGTLLKSANYERADKTYGYLVGGSFTVGVLIVVIAAVL